MEDISCKDRLEEGDIHCNGNNGWGAQMCIIMRQKAHGGIQCGRNDAAMHDIFRVQLPFLRVIRHVYRAFYKVTGDKNGVHLRNYPMVLEFRTGQHGILKKGFHVLLRKPGYFGPVLHVSVLLT